MRINRVEIKGFKSFPDKTTLSFDQNITGIAGPNGCGKSNIVDAIRWVIGEQKISALRSEKLESLIFNGSVSRSESGLAEVSITFENTRNLLSSQFDNVAITRRFFKSGESEYELNGVSCRLKDIQNLLLDTGISADSYAIIELGMIDEIIKDKDNSRRKMLEQAAGISIFKTRKKETQQKLNATNDNLSRLEDILFEIKSQLKDLEKQATQAETYVKLKKQYKEKSVHYASVALRNIKSDYKNQGENMHSIQLQISDIKTSLQLLEINLENTKLAYDADNNILKEKQQALNQLEKRIVEKESEKKLQKQQKEHFAEKHDNAKKFFIKDNQQIEQLKKSLSFTKKQLEEKEGTTDQEEKNVGKHQREVAQIKQDVAQARETLKNILKQIQETREEKYATEKDIAVLEAKIHNNNIATKQSEEKLKEGESSKKTLTQKQALAKITLAENKEELATETQRVEKYKKKILLHQQELETKRVAMLEVQRQLDAKKNEYSLLKNVIDSLEGYPESVKFIHHHSEWHHAPLLSETLTIESEYQLCIEHYLEEYMSYYVVEKVEQAHQAIILLKKHNKGKVRFLAIPPEFQQTDPAVDVPNGCISAIEVVKVKPPLQHILPYLLHNVFISIDHQQPLHHKEATIIDKKGYWYTQPYTLSGGSIGSFEGNRTGRYQKLETLEKEMNLLAEKVDHRQEKVQRLQELVQASSEKLGQTNVPQLQEEVNQAIQATQRLANTIETHHKQLENIKTAIQYTQEKNILLKEEAEQKQQQLLHQQEKEQEQVALRKEAEINLETKEKEAETIIEALGQKHIQYTNHQHKIEALKNEVLYKKEQLEQINHQIIERKKEQELATQHIQETEKRKKEIEQDIFSMLKEKDNLQHSVNQHAQALDQKRNTIIEKETIIKTKNKQREALEQQEQGLKEKSNTIQLQMASIKERLDIEFNIDIDTILKSDDAAPQDAEDEARLKAKAEKIKHSLEKMGDVNPMAIEAFETHKKRYDFMMNQKSDLEEGKETLLQTIKEVERSASQSFNETFNQIKTHFQRVFKTLFTQEDTAILSLSMPDNFAETAINITAKPKGKRPASITQLSGGEKALTSIAFLFALYLVKPAPFCILDEVDAPLDDANVLKFTKMVKEFSEDSQFIIVTHNKMTMSFVDVIYGVTMQEAGVSKLVPVDFRNFS